MDVLRRVLELAPVEAATLPAWWEATRDERARGASPIDRAVVGGALADRIGFAFAGGYHEALQQLAPSLGGARASLCATEETGNHPRAIRTTLTRVAEHGWQLTGHKTWATVADAADRLLVIASAGERDGNNRLVMVTVRAGQRGVTLVPAAAPFVPEIPHAGVTFDRVDVGEAELWPGDGYADYLKPFRTIEDVHVHGALLGYALGLARRHRLGELASGLAAAIATVHALAAEDPKAATTHLALAGVIDHAASSIATLEARWQGGDERARWERDRRIFSVAGAARTARLARAREQLGLA